MVHAGLDSAGTTCSEDGKLRIGDKNSMVRQLQSITGIASDALHGLPLARFSVDDRMARAANRNTSREEDGAYCLLGVFEVFMPLIYGEGRKGAFSRLRKMIDEASTPHSPKQKASDAYWNVPFLKNRHFVGQEAYLNRLENLIFSEEPPPAIAITGLGGVGKTQIVIELAHRTRARLENCSIFWLPATSTESLQQGFADIAQLLKVYASGQEENATKKAVQRALEQQSTGRWLLILDNVDDMNLWSSELRDFLPRNQHGCVVCTTRSRKVAIKIAASDIIEMSEMEEKIGMELLSELLIRRELLDAKQDAQELLTQLTFLPLAIAQAAAYINENGITLSEYLSLLTEQEEEVVDILSEEFEDMGRYDSARNPVATTWLLSFEQMCRQNQLAADYLSLMACVDTKAIPRTLLPPAKSSKSEADAFGTLSAYYFVNRRSADNTFDVHRLVYLAMRNQLRKEGTLAQWNINTLIRLKGLLPKRYEESVASSKIWRAYLPHARVVLNVQVEEDLEMTRGDLLWSFANCLLSDGRYAEAETSLLEVSQLKQRVLGDQHEDLLAIKRYLAHTYLGRGRFGEAKRLALNILETSQGALGDEHEETLKIKDCMAELYAVTSRWGDAEKLRIQVLAARRRFFGEEHKYTALRMTAMAKIYSHQGRWKEAEGLEVQALRIHQRLFEKEHNAVLMSMNDLALTYLQSGDLAKAEEMYTQLVQIQARVLGKKHPESLISLANLAEVYKEQNRWDEAEKLYEELIEASKAVLGEKHYKTIIRKTHLWEVYRRQGRWKEAEELGLQVVELNVEVLGDEHRDTLILMGHLALTYWNLGRIEEAEKLEVRVLEGKSRVFGENHRGTFTSMNNLACTWKSLGRDEEAIALMEKCFELGKAVLGPEHPDTMISSDWLIEWRDDVSSQGGFLNRARRRLKQSKLYHSSMSLVRRPRTRDHD